MLALRYNGRAAGRLRYKGRPAYPPRVFVFVFFLFVFSLLRSLANNLFSLFTIDKTVTVTKDELRHRNRLQNTKRLSVTKHDFGNSRYKNRNGKPLQNTKRYVRKPLQDPNIFPLGNIFFFNLPVIVPAETERRSPSGPSSSATTATRCCRGSCKSPRPSPGSAVCRRRSLPPSSARPPRVP